MFAYVITIDVFTISVLLFRFTSTVIKVNSVWASLTIEEQLFTSETDRCDILPESNNCQKGNPKNGLQFIGIH